MDIMTKPRKQPVSRTKDRHVARRMVRLTEELYQRIRWIAEQHNRPVIWEIRAALAKHAADEEKRLGKSE